MKLQQIEINNYQGARRVLVQAEKPVTLVIGANGAGKSSIRDAVIHAVLDGSARVDLKKNYGALVSDGAKAGSVAIAFDSFTSSLAVPKGDRKGSGALSSSEQVAAVCLEPSRFGAMDGKQRRAFLFDLMGVKISGKTVREKLLARGVAESKADDVLPLLSVGFENAQKAAAENATKAKGAWRAVTGETYGEKKAETWAAPVSDSMPPAPEAGAVDAMDRKIGSLQRDIGAMSARQHQVGAIRDAQLAANRLPRIEQKLATDREALAEFLPQVEALRAAAAGQRKSFLACPCCSEKLEIANGALIKFADSKQPDEEAKAKLPEYEKALSTLQNAVKNSERDLVGAKHAAITVEQAKDQPQYDEAEDARLRAELTADQSRLQALRTAAAAYEKAAAEAATAEKKTADAAAWHAEVLAWLQIADMLAPNGLPAEFLADALEPFNQLLDDESGAAGWESASIGPDMEVTLGGRLYKLLCESEKWRADAILAAVIAQRSGLKFMMMDRLDVLDTDNRSKALYWLDGLGEIGVSALVFGTMGKLPAPMPANIAGLQIVDGQVCNVDREEA